MDPEANGNEITQAVLAVLGKHISEGEIIDVKRCLPEDLRRHWKAKR